MKHALIFGRRRETLKTIVGRKLFCWLGMILLCCASLSPLLFASYDYKLDSRQVKMGQFESEIGAKLGRGATNILYGWTEIARTATRWSGEPEHGFWEAVTIGIPYGVFRMMGRTIVGVYEVATCYAPQKPIFSPIEGDVV